MGPAVDGITSETGRTSDVEEMATVRLERGRGTRKCTTFGSIVAVLLIGAFIFRENILAPVDSTSRGAAPSGTKGRLITFELASLKGGGTGNVTIQTRPSWAPRGVAQFHALVDAGFFEGCRFFRVLPNFMVQFGLSGDPAVQRQWETAIADDPVVGSNTRGMVTFATAGPNTRTTQLFINTKKNSFLDKQGFSPIGEIISGMEFVDQINDEYREEPDQGMIESAGNAYLEKNFPNLSYISSTEENAPAKM